nr:hypothetical protein [Deltaproteobacteria bacterium]
LERRLPPEHPQLLASEGRRAQLRWDGGERHEALDDLVAVIDRAHAAGVAGLPLAELELQLGLWRAEVSPERARDPLLRAHEVFAAIAPEHPEAVRARLALAQLPTPRQTTAPLSEPAP